MMGNNFSLTTRAGQQGACADCSGNNNHSASAFQLQGGPQNDAGVPPGVGVLQPGEARNSSGPCMVAAQAPPPSVGAYSISCILCRIKHIRDTAKAALNIPEQDTLGVQTAVSLETIVVVLPNATNPIIVVILL